MKSDTNGSNIYDYGYYDSRFINHSWLDYKEKLAEALRYGLPGKLLDIGSGLGFMVECCQKFGLYAIGVERSGEAIAKAKARCGAEGFIQHSLENPTLPFKDGVFSVAMLHQVIEHLRPHVARLVLKETYRVLQPRGILMVYSPSRSYKQNRLDSTHINLYTPASLRKEVVFSGFKIIAEPNWPRQLLGGSVLGNLLMRGILKAFPADFFSISANCIGQKG